MLGQNILVKTNGTASAQVARWRFELKDGVATTQDKIDFPVTRTDGKFDVVSEGTIAPGTWGEIPITVVTTGTEVHMKYDIEIVIENCPTNLKFYKDAKHKKEFPTVRSGTGEEGDLKTATITIERYVDKDKHEKNGEHEHIIYWYWPFETGKGNQINSNDVIDTEDMKMDLATLAITATGIQVLEVQPNEGEVIPELYAWLYDDNTLVLSSRKDAEYNGTMTKAYKYFSQNNLFSSTNAVWSDDRSKITKVVIKDKITPTAINGWFSDFSNLVEIENIRNLDISNIASMFNMFSGCTSLTNLDLSSWDTSNVKEMNYVFDSCTNLTNLDISGWDTSSVISMQSMFQDCTSLTNLNLSRWDTSSVTSIKAMFTGCTNLANLDISSWDTSSVKEMERLFYNCRSLTNLDLSSWDTSNVTSMYAMFCGCRSLTNLDLSSWDTSSVNSMRSMFQGCTNLASLNLSGWNTSSLTSTETMFSACTNLASLDLSSWDTQNVKTMYCMFNNCNNIETIYVSENFNTDNVTSSTRMFSACKKLKGGNNTKYSPNYTDKRYARIDTPETPGYFTKK